MINQRKLHSVSSYAYSIHSTGQLSVWCYTGNPLNCLNASSRVCHSSSHCDHTIEPNRKFLSLFDLVLCLMCSVKQMMGPAPHTQLDADLAAGMGMPDNGPKLMSMWSRSFACRGLCTGGSFALLKLLTFVSVGCCLRLVLNTSFWVYEHGSSQLFGLSLCSSDHPRLSVGDDHS